MGGTSYNRRGIGFALNPSCIIATRKALQATALPLILYGTAFQLAIWGSAWLAFPTMKVMPDLGLGLIQGAWNEVTQLSMADCMIGAVYWAVLYAIFVIPSLVVLIRVQASLLPDGERTVVPFDRTFGVQKVWTRGYLTTWESFRSVSLSSWGRVYWIFFESYACVLFQILCSAVLYSVHIMFFWSR